MHCEMSDSIFVSFCIYIVLSKMRGLRGRDHMVVGLTTTCAIIANHHFRYEFEPRLWRGVLDTTVCDKVCQ
jgi:hypothetical protein